MIHLGDITKISGYTAPVVDCIIGGSPCQDLSVAGKRAGLEGQRSGLFMEQIRIIKEMRENERRNGRAAEYVRPRYMVWENVPGAFSSNKGEDFRVVLEEVARIIDEGVSIPRPPKGKWRTTGVIIGDGYSIAWRVFDAKYWGVPQRRRRICLVADFNGYTAPQIVFSEDQYYRSTKRSDREPSVGYIGDESRSEVQSFCKSVSGDSEPGESEGKGASSDTERSSGASDCERPSISFQERGGKPGGGKGIPIQEDHVGALSTLQNQYVVDRAAYCFEPGAAKRLGGYVWEGIAPTLRANAGDNQIATVYSVENHPNDSRVGINEDGIVQALTTRMGTGGGNVPMVIALDRASFNQGKNAQFDIGISEDGVAHTCVAKGPGAVAYAESINGDVAGTLDASYYKGCGMRSGVERDVVAYWDGSQTCGTLTANNAGGNQRMPDKDNFNCVIQDVSVAYSVDCRNASVNADTNGTLQAKESGGTSYNLNNFVITTRPRYIVRRLTPMECERLQGYPDGWTDIGEYTNSNGKKCKASDASRYKALGNSIALPSWKWVLKRICGCYERDATMASLFDGIGGFPYLWEQINGKGSCLWASEIEEFPIAVTKERIG